MLVLTDSGALKMLQNYFDANSLTLRLFTNDIVPADTDLVTSYTEANGGGYTPISLPAKSFACSIQGGIAQALHSAVLFSFSGPLSNNPDVFGYYVTDSAGVLLFAERRQAKYTPTNPGDALSLSPVFQLSKGTPS